MTTSRADAAPAERVRSLELFFDLVFVFTITQVAAVLTASPTGAGLARAVALLGIIWWMYGGYAWLTNALDLDRTGPRLLLLTGMAAYFVMSLAVPRFFDDGPFALILGIAYLVVVSVHIAAFLGTSGRAAIARLGPLNLVSALLVVVAGTVPVDARLWVLLGAVVLQYVSPHLVGIGGFVVGAGHFVERHGLALIILLGESIIAVGVATSDKGDVPTLVLGSLLALAVSAGMWWLYFDREEAAGEELLDAMPAARRGRAALFSFGYAYLVMILGVTVAAVGMKKAVTYFTEPLHDFELWLMPLGLAGYLAGLVLFHRSLAPAWQWRRLGAAVAVLLCVPAGLVAGWLMLAVGAVILAATALGARRE
ncbi:MAG: low temperature requirement protein A [Actinophytocola sp.]|uniref:low temperature requirement protein A n=1 Tax=Actinophytocola sp. TaxID=1872138 RepID=UPI001325FA68|nr:low temperature requirement protein A [Actinophytocola sp.]MPZ83782.1 low temperature requirement protein A [Actinophytocola sp.]